MYNGGSNNIILQNKNWYKLINKCYKVFILFLYILLLELVIYLFIKTILYIFNKIKKSLEMLKD